MRRYNLLGLAHVVNFLVGAECVADRECGMGNGDHLVPGDRTEHFFRPAVWGLLILAAVKGVSVIYFKVFAKRKLRSTTPLTPKLQAKHESTASR
jgi:hypothetical protein